MKKTREEKLAYHREYYKKHKRRMNARAKEYREANGDRVRASHRKWAEENKEHRREYAARYKERRRELNSSRERWRHLSRYGLSKDSWHELLISQSGRCAICVEVMENPQVDHCHETGVVRGLLCFVCNTGIGKFRHDVGLLSSAARYLNEARAA